MSVIKAGDFARLFVDDVPILDVRAPVEFAKGALSCSINVPLLNDVEREQIGITYANEGHDVAVALGADLIKGQVKQARVKLWAQFVQDYPKGVLVCFRGGMRSKIVQQWIFEETGIILPRIDGGYKALRRYLIDQIESLSRQTKIIILSGRTGSGKTLLLKQLSHAIDLEGLANHRGSSIGRQISPQPTQIIFENNVAVSLLKFNHKQYAQLVLEDESPNIGSIHIPHGLYEKMSMAPCVMLDTPFERRVDIIIDEYVGGMLRSYEQHAGSKEQGFLAFGEYLRVSLERVKRRLGGERYQSVREKMDFALKVQSDSGDTNKHRDWIQFMLKNYYDPMYDYQRDKRQRPVLFQGEAESIKAFI